MILNNPFHVLGLPANCTVKDRTRREGKIKAYLRVGRPLAFNDDLHFAGCRRHEVAVKTAIRALEDASERLRCGLFWFTKGGILDDRPLRMLSDKEVGDPDLNEVFALWKRVEPREVTANYASSLNNFGTLCLLAGLQTNQKWRLDGCSRRELVVRGLRAKARVIGKLERQALSDFCADFSDPVVANDVNRIVELFLDALKRFLAEAEKYGVDLPTDEVVLALDAGGDRCARFKEELAMGPRRELERAIAKCARDCKESPGDADEAAWALGEIADEQLPELLAVVSKNDFVYTSLADRVAKTMLNAAIAFFNSSEYGGELHVIATAKNIVSEALEFACGVDVRERAQENLAALTSRERQARLAPLQEGIHQWLGESSNLLQRDYVRPETRILFVCNALSWWDETSVLAQMNKYRTQGMASDSNFATSEDMAGLASIVCQMLISHLVSACNESQGRVTGSAEPLLQYMKTTVFGGRLRDRPNVPGEPQTFFVDGECRERLATNYRIVVENTAGGFFLGQEPAVTVFMEKIKPTRSRATRAPRPPAQRPRSTPVRTPEAPVTKKNDGWGGGCLIVLVVFFILIAIFG